jgi:hypothetical protein
MNILKSIKRRNTEPLVSKPSKSRKLVELDYQEFPKDYEVVSSFDIPESSPPTRYIGSPMRINSKQRTTTKPVVPQEEQAQIVNLDEYTQIPKMTQYEELLIRLYYINKIFAGLSQTSWKNLRDFIMSDHNVLSNNVRGYMNDSNFIQSIFVLYLKNEFNDIYPKMVANQLQSYKHQTEPQQLLKYQKSMKEKKETKEEKYIRENLKIFNSMDLGQKVIGIYFFISILQQNIFSNVKEFNDMTRGKAMTGLDYEKRRSYYEKTLQKLLKIIN